MFLTRDNTNEDPVKYCSKCYSLKIKYEEVTDSEYCDKCGCTSILEDSFENWERKYENRYKKKFLEENTDPRKSYLFKLSIAQLKDKVYDSAKWKDIIHIMAPNFPKGLNKTDSILLFFDFLCKNNKIDDLRFLLYKFIKH